MQMDARTNVFDREANPRRSDPLTEDTRADVVVIGGGLVGLSCARTLRGEGLDVVVLEREHVGHSSSGRHFGVVCPHLWPYGDEHPEVLAQWGQDSLDVIERMLAAEEIECDQRRFDFWLPIRDKAYAEVVPRRAEWYRQLGQRVRAVPPEEVECTTMETYGALVVENLMTVDPWLLTRGLRAAALRQGVRLFEGTAAESIEGGAEVTVKTGGGTVQAGKAILAVNAFSGQFSFAHNYVVPVSTHAIATEPLTDATVAAIGCRDEDILIDYLRAPGPPQYYQRYRHDGRFYFGGGQYQPSPAPGQLPPEADAEKFRTIHAEMLLRYPVLKDVRIEAGWGGPLAGTMNGCPNILALPDQQNVILAVVCNGNGVALGLNAGRLVKGLVLGRDTLDEETRIFLDWCDGSLN